MAHRKTGKRLFWASMAGVLALCACSLTEPAASSVESTVPLSESAVSGDDELLQEYRQAGFDVRPDGWFYQGQRVHELTDGVANVTRYRHMDDRGVVNVQVVRAETPLADGSVELFGPIVELRLSDAPAGQGVSASTSENTVTVEAQARELAGRDSSVQGSELGENGTADGKDMEAQTSETTDSDAMKQLNDLTKFGVTSAEIDGDVVIRLHGKKLSGLLDQQGDLTVLYAYTQGSDEPVGVVVRDAQGSVTGVVSMPQESALPTGF